MLETELFALLEQTADAAYTVTDDGEIRSWNRAAERLFGYPAREVLGRDVDEVLDARDVLGTEALAGGLEAATRRWSEASGGIPSFDLEVRARSGQRIWVNVSTIVFDNPRAGRRLFARLARDISHRRHQEQLLDRALEAARQLVALTDDAPGHAPVEPLSARERRILELFADGGGSAAVARVLGISPQTLRNHLHHINRKLRTHSRLEAVTHALQRGLLDRPGPHHAGSGPPRERIQRRRDVMSDDGAATRGGPRLKRAYEPAEASDGYRILVDRLWPRGVSKDRAAIDEWMKEIAPSAELRQWFGHDPARWPEFQKRYRAELREHADLVRQIAERAAHGPVTLVFGAKDEAHNDAVVLAAAVRARLKRAAARRGGPA
jgi:PAS domain S-box-containing protein